jgi:glucose-fructose oxidoreductase
MGGGALLDMGVYAIQGARLGTGLEPLAVTTATLSTTRPEVYKDGLEETAIATLEFPGNILAQIKTSFGENINFLTVNGEKGELNMKPFSGYDGVQGGSPLGTINHPYKAPWQQARQMDDDAMAILQQQPALVPGEEGLRDIRIVEAIKQSAALSRRIAL